MIQPRNWLSRLFVRPFALPAAQPRSNALSGFSLRTSSDRLVPAVYSITGAADNTLAVDTSHAGTAADPFLAPSLRSAINAANSHAGADSIVFDPTAFATAKTILLGGTQLELSDDVSISGPAAGVFVNGNNLSRVLQG